MPSEKQIGAHPEWQEAGMRVMMREHFGPASYPIATGEVIRASAYSVEQFFSVETIGSLITNSSGVWFGTVRSIKTIGGNGCSQWTLRYYDTSGVEIVDTTDLSGKRVVLLVRGI
jgi:hypothetical protein